MESCFISTSGKAGRSGRSEEGVSSVSGGKPASPMGSNAGGSVTESPGKARGSKTGASSGISGSTVGLEITGSAGEATGSETAVGTMGKASTVVSDEDGIEILGKSPSPEFVEFPNSVEVEGAPIPLYQLAYHRSAKLLPYQLSCLVYMPEHTFFLSIWPPTSNGAMPFSSS